MWARVVELLLGAWLVLSPLIFRGTPGLERHVVNDVIAGALAALFALLCFWQPTRRAHLLTLALGAYLAMYGYFSAERPGPPAAQNDIAVGLLLMIFAVVPTEAARPPIPWREHEAEGQRPGPRPLPVD